MTSNYERKRELLTFLLGSKETQSELFSKIIYKDLDKFKEFMDDLDKSELGEYSKILNEDIYNSKLKEIKTQTNALKEQMIAQANGIKYNSVVSVIERKLYIIELQIDVGIYNLYHNRNVKFYFDV
uniref:Uncharacterized protein n=1 Tax=viral metagenome TaxID=1070528 RepID=A0A6C0HUU6_9ZZZZ